MSTRCQIGVYSDESPDLKKPTALLYKHYDGYPEGTLPLIEEATNEFLAKRGFYDDEYLAARIMEKLLATDPGGCTGFGICNQFHGDIEFFYAITPSGISVNEVSGENKFHEISKHLFTVNKTN